MRYVEDWVPDQAGNGVAGALVSVYLVGTTTDATIYDFDGAETANPLTADALGRFGFRAADGEYDLYASGDGITPYTKRAVQVVDLVGAGAQVFSVVAYGALGDGTTDDAVGIQAAIDACESAGGGTVFFHAGDYPIESAITIDSAGVALEFADGAEIVVAAAMTSALTVSGASGVTLRNLVLDGATLATEGIRVTNSAGLKIEGGEIHSVGDGSTTSYGIRVLTSATTEGFYATGLSVHDIVGLSTCRGVAFQSSGASTGFLSKIRFSGCQFYDITPAADADAIVIQQVLPAGAEGDLEVDAVISDCQFRECAKRAVKIQNRGVTVSNCKMRTSVDETPGCIAVYAGDCTISNNQMVADAGASWLYCVDFNGGAVRDNIVISGNIMAGDATGTVPASSAGIYVRGAAGNIGRVSIVGNTMRYLYDGVRMVGNAACPYSDISIVANTFSGIDEDGIHIDPSTGTIANIRLAGNIGSTIAGQLEHIYPGVTGAETNTILSDIGIFSVAEYGATGDGATDDVAAIQAAIDAAEAAGGGVVKFSQGYFRTSATLTIESSGITLQGAGMGKENDATTGTVISPLNAANFGPLLAIGVAGARTYGSGIADLYLFAANYRLTGMLALVNCTECFATDSRIDMKYADDDARVALSVDTAGGLASETNRFTRCFINSPNTKTGAAAAYGYGVVIANNGAGTNLRNIFDSCKFYNNATDIGGKLFQTEDASVGRSIVSGCTFGVADGDQGITLSGGSGGDLFIGCQVTSGDASEVLTFAAGAEDCVFIGNITGGGTWSDANSDVEKAFVLNSAADNGMVTRGVVFAPRSAAPAAPLEGEVYYDSDDNKLLVWTGAAWETITSA